MKVENYISVELGRANITGNEVIVEFGRAKYPERILQNLSINSVIELDTQLTEALTFSAPVYVNGHLAAKGHPKFDQEHHFIIVDEIIDEMNNTLNLEEGEIIELNMDKTRSPTILDVIVNGHLVANGEIVKGINDSKCYVVITEAM